VTDGQNGTKVTSMKTMTPESRFESDGLAWRIHFPNLLKEILVNDGCKALAVPLNIIGQTLHDLAELAIEIDDPRLHLMMFDMTLYDVADLDKTDREESARTRKRLVEQCEAMKAAK